MEPDNQLVFIASCVEGLARYLGQPYNIVFERMDKVGMIDKYIYPFYDVLHLESREAVTKDIAETLKKWEEQL